MTERQAPYTTNSIRIELPWPDARLSPNSRQHRLSKIGSVRNARNEARFAAIDAGAKSVTLTPPLYRHIDIYPPDGRRRDADNIIASLKSALDGIADAIGIDDRMSSVSSGSWRVCDRTEGGKIIIIIGEDHP